MLKHAPDLTRRRLLKASLGATVLFQPVPYAWVWAQSEGASRLLRLPKIALVLGNSRYAHARPLVNPGNDAAAISDVLRKTGFAVTTALDATQEEMNAAIRSYVQSLAASKAVGLFYFAGHGLQLAWRNYLVPVDAAVRTTEDIPRSCVDLTALMQGINKAANPMNVVVLDACRDNPFGSAASADGRGLARPDAPAAAATQRGGTATGPGLSQMDAPQGTLLAYATAPGNVASDGDGTNGLYTEHLLREILRPEAKIEDIFKRVRLQVRRRTNGRQIPWESTSLEEDFYFVPPQALAQVAQAEAEHERKRKQEQALLEARRAAEDAERKRQQELAMLEQQRMADAAERKRKAELALQEAQRVAEAAERKRREDEAREAARLAEAEAARRHQAETAELKRKQEEALREARLAEEAAERERKAVAGRVSEPAAALAARQFEEELALWEKIRDTRAPEPLEDYLLRYPSGRFAELAQLRLDQALALQGEQRIEIVPDAKNPFTKGSATANTRYRAGDSYTYRRLNTDDKSVLETFTTTVSEITDTEVIYDRGLVTNLLGNVLRTPDGRRFSDNQGLPLEFSIGKRWTSRYHVMQEEVGSTTRDGLKPAAGTRVGTIDMDYRILAREPVTVPAGTFDTFHIRARGWSTGTGANIYPVRVELETWFAPGQVRRPVIFESRRTTGPKVIEAIRQELVAFRES